jgi:hypothetical protein
MKVKRLTEQLEEEETKEKSIEELLSKYIFLNKIYVTKDVNPVKKGLTIDIKSPILFLVLIILIFTAEIRSLLLLLVQI